MFFVVVVVVFIIVVSFNVCPLIETLLTEAGAAVVVAVEGIVSFKNVIILLIYKNLQS